MSQQNIDFGTFPDDPDADAIRIAFQKVQNNFTELFTTTVSGQVISINRSPGAGIQVNSPTGNVIITADIACVQVATSSLSIGQGGNGGTSATITGSAQTLYVDINPTQTLSNTFAAVGGGLANLTGTLTSAAATQPNITSTGTLISLAVTGNITAGNIFANSGTIGATSLVGTLTTTSSSQPNITTIGTLSNLAITGTGNSNLGNTATANFFIGDGSGLTNLSVTAGSNIINGTSNVVVALSGNVSTSVSGNANIIVATGNGVNVAGYITSSGNVTANTIISTIATGTAPFTITSTTQVANLNVANAGLATYATTANAVAGANVSGTVASATNSSAVLNNVLTTGTYYPTFISSTANGNYPLVSNTAFSANIANGAFIATTFIGNFQGNISGNIGVSGSNTQVLFNDSGNANATAGFTFDKVTNVVTMSGNLTSANANLGNTASANYFIGSGNNLSNIQGANVTGAVAYATTANAVAGANVTGAVTYATTANAVAGANVTGTVANATYAVSSGSSTTAATVTTNAQPNITSVGTLSSLIVTNTTSTGVLSATGNVSGGNITTAGQLFSSIATGTAPLVVTSTTQVANLNAATAGTANSATTAATVTTNAQPNITSVGTLTNLSVSGTVTASILVSNVVTGTAPFNVTSTTQVANLSVATAGSATTAATVTTNAQPNITSVGTLTNVNISGNVTSGNLYANSGTIKGNYFIGDGGGLSNISIAAGTTIVNGNSNVNIPSANGNINFSAVGNANIVVITGTGANITGNLSVTSNITASRFNGNFNGNVTTAAQGNITSLGTLTGLTSNGIVNFSNTTDVNLGSNSNVNIAGGANGYFLQTDGTGNLSWTNAALVPVPGANTYVIYNNAGSYGSNSNFVYNQALSTLTVPNINATLTSGPQTGITAVGTLTSLIVNGTISSANISGGNTVSANFLTGILTTAAQPNISSVGTLTSLTVTGNISGGNITGTHYGAATGLTSIPGANVTGTVANATYAVSSGSSTTAATVTTNAQPNITSVGTLSSLTVTGTVSSGNLSTGGTLTVNGTGVSSINGNLNMNSKYVVSVSDPVNLQDAATKNYVDTLVSTGIAYHPAVSAATTTTLANTTVGTITYNNGASGVGANLVTTGSFNLIDTANVQTIGTRILVKDEANASWNGVYTWSNTTTIVRATDADSYGPGSTELSENDYFFVTNGSVNRGTAWVVTTVGTIVFGTTSITFSQFSSSQTYSAGTGLTLTSTTFSVNASQTQITSVGTLGSLSVTGNANVGALYATSLIQGTTLTSTVANGTPPITVTSTTLVPNLYVARANISDYDSVTLATTGTYYPTFVNATSGNLARVANGVYVVNLANGSLSATTFVGSLSGAATTAGTVTNPAQTSITSVGTLTSLAVTGNISGANITGTHYGAATGLTSIPGGNVTGTVANATYSTTAGTATNSTTAVTAATVTTNAQPNITSVGTLTTLIMTGGSSITGGNLVSANFLTGTLTTAAQPNISSVGTLTSLTVTGNISGGNITGTHYGAATGLTSIPGANVTGTVANATYAVSSGSTITAGTVTTNAQPNITSVGTLTGLGVNGNISAVNITATIGVFTGNGSGLTAITGASVTGTVPNATSATTAGTVTTAAQPNITSVGTLTSLISSGNIQGANIIATGYHIRSVGTGISAAGTTQGTATILSKEINIVSTVTSASGVQLPTAVAGMVVTITNTSANSLLVYPATSTAINTLAINVGFTQTTGATIQFIAPTTTQWYTVGGTYA